MASAAAVGAVARAHLQPYLALVSKSRLLAPNLKEMYLNVYTGNRDLGNAVGKCVMSYLGQAAARGGRQAPASRPAPSKTLARASAGASSGTTCWASAG